MAEYNERISNKQIFSTKKQVSVFPIQEKLEGRQFVRDLFIHSVNIYLVLNKIFQLGKTGVRFELRFFLIPNPMFFLTQTSNWH